MLIVPLHNISGPVGHQEPNPTDTKVDLAGGIVGPSATTDCQLAAGGLTLA